MAQDRVEKWIRRVLTDANLTNEGTRKCFAISLMHVTSGIKTEVQTQKLGSKPWDPKQLADMFEGIADEHSAGLSSTESGSGQESYNLVAFFDDMPDLPQCPLPLMRRTGPMALPDDPVVSEPPTPKGELQQAMRHKEGYLQFVLEAMARTFSAQTMVLEMQQKRLAQVERENQDTMELAKEMIFKEAANAHAYVMVEKDFERKTEERKRLMQAAPAVINQLLGREVIPQSTVDSTLIEGLFDSLDEPTIAKVLEVIGPKMKPEVLGLLLGRATQVIEANNAKRKAAAEAAAAKVNVNGGTNGTH